MKKQKNKKTSFIGHIWPYMAIYMALIWPLTSIRTTTLHIHYGPSVACTAGLYMAYVQLMYGPYMAYV